MLSQLAPTLPDLQFSANVPSVRSHEIDGVARGLAVYHRGTCIVGEGMGIGAPLALKGKRAVFPLDSEISQTGHRVTKRFHLNSLSQKYVGKVRADIPYKWIRSQLAPVYLRSSRFRPLFNYLMAARTAVGIKSHYEKSESCGYVDVGYEFNDHIIRVLVDASRLEADKFLVANELDGRLFTQLTIDKSTKVGKIPPWLEVKGERASVSSPQLHIRFSLEHLHGCRLFAGREVSGQRLNWAGCSYQPEHGLQNFSYSVEFDRDD